MRVFTRKSFVEFMAGISGSKIMALTIKTDASTRKGAPAIHKIKHCPCGLGWDYPRQRAKAEGVPVEELSPPKKDPWHRPVAGAIHRHRDDDPTQEGARLYVQYYPLQGGSTTRYELDGDIYDYSQVLSYLTTPRPEGKRPRYRLTKVENIVGGTLDHEGFVVV